MSANQTETPDTMTARARKAFAISFITMSVFLQVVNLALLFTNRIDVLAYGLVAVFGELIVMFLSIFVHAMSM